jgi:hypothetical protein
VRRWSQPPPPEFEEIRLAFEREKGELMKQEDELTLLQRMWERGEEEEMRKANEEFHARRRR